METKDIIENQRILFITTKNLSYIRNRQEITLIKQFSKNFSILGASSKHYPKRLFHVFSGLFKTKWEAYDVIFVGFAPQLVLPFIHSKIEDKVIIEDFFISLYDTFCLDRKKFRPNGLIGKILHRLDSHTLSLADYVIADTASHASFFTSEFGSDSSKHIVLYLDAVPSCTQFFENHQGSQNNTLNNGNSFKILYFGSILPLQGVDIILEAVSQIKENSNLHFEIIGPINRKLMKKAPVSSNITYYKWLEEDELYRHILDADLCLAGHFSSTIDKAKRTIPGKAFIYQSLNRPMILGDTPANHELFSPDSPGIYYVPLGNPKALSDEILRLASLSSSEVL